MTDGSDEIAGILSRARRRRGRRGLWLGLAALVALGLAALVYVTRQGADPVRYVTEPVERGSLIVQVTATGTVQPTTRVEVSSELSGTIAEVAVDYNDRVEIGQVLARLDDTKLRALVANAEAQLAGARARVAQADATRRETARGYERAVELDRRGIKSSSDLDTAAAAHDRAEAALDSARADLTLAEANLALQAADLDKAVIRAPIRGIVLDRAAEKGQIVASSLNTPVLFTLAEDLARMELQVDIDEADIGRVAPGNPALFTVDAFPRRSFPAEIVQIRYAPESSDGVVTYKAVLSVENPEGLLRPGMTATAAITVAEARDVLTLPNAALRYSPPRAVTRESGGSGLIGMIMPRPPERAAAEPAEGEAVWVLRDGQPVQVPVTTGETDGRRTELREGDLSEGEPLVTDQSGTP